MIPFFSRILFPDNCYSILNLSKGSLAKSVVVSEEQSLSRSLGDIKILYKQKTPIVLQMSRGLSSALLLKSSFPEDVQDSRDKPNQSEKFGVFPSVRKREVFILKCCLPLPGFVVVFVLGFF